MTALNMIVRRGAAFLITDGALYDADGVVLHEQSKVAIAERLNMAIACSGMVAPDFIATFLGDVQEGTEALLMLPHAVRAAVQRNADAPHHVRDVTLAAVHWSEVAGEAQGWIVASDQRLLGSEYEPFTLAQIDQITAPAVPLGGIAPGGDLLRDDLPIIPAALQLLALQRHMPHVDGRHFIGGRVELTAVSPAGVEKVVLGAWPDPIGQPISPARPFEIALPTQTAPVEKELAHG